MAIEQNITERLTVTVLHTNIYVYVPEIPRLTLHGAVQLNISHDFTFLQCTNTSSMSTQEQTTNNDFKIPGKKSDYGNRFALTALTLVLNFKCTVDLISTCITGQYNFFIVLYCILYCKLQQ